MPKHVTIHRYNEIFWGGALFFSLIYKLKNCHFYISDSNRLLIETYQAIRDEVDTVIRHLSKFENSKDCYEEVRAWDRAPTYSIRSRAERASRLIYLNKTCFNGLYRVNSTGEFNVPFGKYKSPNFCDESNLHNCAEALQGVTLEVRDYQDTLKRIRSNDFVYLDPPYEPVSKTASFNSYTDKRFDEVDQTRLFKYCQSLASKKALFLLSNSSATWLSHLYRKDDRFFVGSVNANRSINSDKHGRGPVREIVVRNYR